jgi:hypothetical protein
MPRLRAACSRACTRARRQPDRRRWSSATSVATLTSPLFAFPTALARLGGRLLITNAQLNVPDDPTLPFTVVDLGLRAATA